MGVSHLYKDFGDRRRRDFEPNASDPDLDQEEEKLQSFEDGYKSGWDDAIAAQKQSTTAISAGLEQSLQEASFSYHEARSALVSELRQFFEPLLDSFLPALAKETLAPRLLEQIAELSSELVDRKIEIAVSPARMVAVQELCSDKLQSPFEIQPDEALLEDQVFLRVGDQEREIELQAWLTNINRCVQAFFEQLDGGQQND